MAVMGSDDIVVGKNPATRKPAAASENPTNPASAPATSPAREEHCGAMPQQRADSGTASTPQKFLRLIGCHEQKPRRSGGR
jgi:hypothetical protein